MGVGPRLGLIFTIVLLLALFFFVPGYAEWVKELLR